MLTIPVHSVNGNLQSNVLCCYAVFRRNQKTWFRPVGVGECP